VANTRTPYKGVFVFVRLYTAEQCSPMFVFVRNVRLFAVSEARYYKGQSTGRIGKPRGNLDALVGSPAYDWTMTDSSTPGPAFEPLVGRHHIYRQRCHTVPTP